jgi:2-keto-4-pentenoate hydratase
LALDLKYLPYYHTNMKQKMATQMEAVNTAEIAQKFVTARQKFAALEAFPGVLPISREAAYAVQEIALQLWKEKPSGWKVALTAPAFQNSFGEERLSGPVFPSQMLRSKQYRLNEFVVFQDGFAAVEAEYIAVMAVDAPHFDHTPTADEAAQLIASLHIGIETAGSPLASINELGPMAVVSDFGNNAGVIIGPKIENWRSRPLESMTARMLVDDVEVGVGSAAKIPGGPMAAVAFLLYHLQQRGRPLKKGQLISTGATTGIHVVQAGSLVCADFGVDGKIEASAVSQTQ